MSAQAPRAPTPSRSDAALTAIWNRLQQQYALHRRSATFWTAYQGLQEELVHDHPRDRARLCNAMAGMAAKLGAVERAQLLDRNTGCTPR